MNEEIRLALEAAQLYLEVDCAIKPDPEHVKQIQKAGIHGPSDALKLIYKLLYGN